MPTSECCSGQLRGVVLRVCFNSARTVRPSVRDATAPAMSQVFVVDIDSAVNLLKQEFAGQRPTPVNRSKITKNSSKEYSGNLIIQGRMKARPTIRFEKEKSVLDAILKTWKVPLPSPEEIDEFSKQLVERIRQTRAGGKESAGEQIVGKG